MFTYEIKYLVPIGRAEEIRSWARARLDAPPNGSGTAGDVYGVSNLYFDTEGFDVFHRRGSFKRSRYRIRRYGSGNEVFLERKLKRRSKVWRRRSVIGANDIGRLTENVAAKGWDGYWFHRRLLLRRLTPICQVAYTRTARVATSEYGPVRLIIDENIQAVPVRTTAFEDHSQGSFLTEDQAVVKLIYGERMPALFKRLVEEFTLDPQGVSKYRLAAAALGCVPAPAPDRRVVLSELSPCVTS